VGKGRSSKSVGTETRAKGRRGDALCVMEEGGEEDRLCLAKQRERKSMRERESKREKESQEREGVPRERKSPKRQKESQEIPV